MKVKDLISVWLHRNNPKIEVKIWSKKQIDYVFSTTNSEKYDLNAEQVDELEVECFYEYYDKEKSDEGSVAEVIIAKNRHGSQGTVKVGWVGRYTKFRSLATNLEEG